MLNIIISLIPVVLTIMQYYFGNKDESFHLDKELFSSGSKPVIMFVIGTLGSFFFIFLLLSSPYLSFLRYIQVNEIPSIDFFTDYQEILDVLGIYTLFNYLFILMYLLIPVFMKVARKRFGVKLPITGSFLFIFIFLSVVLLILLGAFEGYSQGSYLWAAAFGILIAIGTYIYYSLLDLSGKVKCFWIPIVSIIVLSFTLFQGSDYLVKNVLATNSIAGFNVTIKDSRQVEKNYYLVFQTQQFYYLNPLNEEGQRDKKMVLKISSVDNELSYKTKTQR